MELLRQLFLQWTVDRVLAVVGVPVVDGVPDIVGNGILAVQMDIYHKNLLIYGTLSDMKIECLICLFVLRNFSR